MTRVLSFVIAFSVWLFVLPIGVFAQSAVLSLDPSTGTFNKGCSFALNINLDTGGAQTDGTDAILFYDASRLTATSITNGTIYPDFPGNNIDAANGKITISGLASVSAAFSGKGTLATINFTVKDNASSGSTQITFDFDPNNKAKTTDSNVVERSTVVDVLNSVVNGNYVIGTGTCGAQASSAPVSSSAPIIVRPGQPGYGGPVISTPSATLEPKPTPPIITQLPNGGTAELTSALGIIGGILTVLGILGLALL